jgi:hypothetical protein
MQDLTGVTGKNRILPDLSGLAVATARNLVLVPMAVPTVKGGRNKGVRRGRASAKTGVEAHRVHRG